MSLAGFGSSTRLYSKGLASSSAHVYGLRHSPRNPRPTPQARRASLGDHAGKRAGLGLDAAYGTFGEDGRDLAARRLRDGGRGRLRLGPAVGRGIERALQLHLAAREERFELLSAEHAGFDLI